MKNLTVIFVALVLFASCGKEVNKTIPQNVWGYVVDKQWVRPHYDTTHPKIVTMGYGGGFHGSFHSSPHVSSYHSYSHSSYHSSHSYSHPIYRSSFHPIYYPIIYGVRPTYRHTKDKEVLFIGSEFDVFVANKYSIHKVSVDSVLFKKIKRGDFVSFAGGKLIKQYPK